MNEIPSARERFGWLAGVAAGTANAGLLVLFQLEVLDTGGFSIYALPFPLAHFVVCGAICGLAASTVLRRAPPPIRMLMTAAAAAAGLVMSFRIWAFGPNPAPFLGAILAWAAFPALVWAVAQTRPRRAAALIAASALGAIWAVGAIAD